MIFNQILLFCSAGSAVTPGRQAAPAAGIRAQAPPSAAAHQHTPSATHTGNASSSSSAFAGNHPSSNGGSAVQAAAQAGAASAEKDRQASNGGGGGGLFAWFRSSSSNGFKEPAAAARPINPSEALLQDIEREKDAKKLQVMARQLFDEREESNYSCRCGKLRGSWGGSRSNSKCCQCCCLVLVFSHVLPGLVLLKTHNTIQHLLKSCCA